MPELFDLVSFIGAIQGVILAVFLFSKRGRHPATFFLASYVLLFSIGLLEPYAERTLTGSLRIPLLAFFGSSNFLYGPLLFLFIQSLTTDNREFNKRHIFHFFPFAVVFALETGLSYSESGLLTHEFFRFVAFETLIVQILTYNAVAIRILKNSPSTNRVSPDGTRWIRSLLIFITCIYVLSFLISHLILFGVQAAEEFFLGVQLSITFMIYLMTYRLILQPSLFLNPYSKMGDANGNGFIKYQRSGLKQEQADEYLAQLNRYMACEKPYLDSDLSIYTLSQKLNISRNHLTQILNEKLKKNFYEFVNGYRVDEVKRIMQDSRYSHLNLTGIGLEAGFKSRTAFNINFKKIAGCTPTEWKRSQPHDIPAKDA